MRKHGGFLSVGTEAEDTGHSKAVPEGTALLLL